MTENVDRFLDTDMGNRGARIFGLEKAPHDADENAKAIAKLVSSFMFGLRLARRPLILT